MAARNYHHGELFRRYHLTLRSFSNDDGNGNENVITKHKFSLLLSLHDYSKFFNVRKVGVAAEYPAILKLHLRGGWIRGYAVENTTPPQVNF